jgi:molybdate transport system ATP-binding protein
MEGRPTLSGSVQPGSVQPGSVLKVAMRHRVGGLSLDVGFELTKMWTVVFGPSGSGKTTVLRAIAGFVDPDAGTIECGQPRRVLLSTADGVKVPAHLRPVRSAAQTARLFPHMTVRENVEYGMEWGSHPEDEREVLGEVMEVMRLTTLADRGVSVLSGGERQRVSVARAVAAAVAFDGVGKALLLLDEPFAGLDSVLRDELALGLRAALMKWKIPVLSVSHDVGECYLLGAEVVRMAEGKVMEQGLVGVVLARERERLLTRLG